MNNQLFLYVSSFFLTAWGVAHLFPTKGVIKGFGDISKDNKRIITMEWINEGATLIFMGVLIAVMTYVDPYSVVTISVLRISIIMLVALSFISLFTGFRIKFLPFKLCPVIFLTAALLITLGIYL